mmetsp:Transcript_105517/g.303434  ORF Transcript_105517/g.303434 Transcript_105517/m.303434 type:complete len:219 (+) Transcript_105517:246-902(+)
MEALDRGRGVAGVLLQGPGRCPRPEAPLELRAHNGRNAGVRQADQRLAGWPAGQLRPHAIVLHSHAEENCRALLPRAARRSVAHENELCAPIVRRQRSESSAAHPFALAEGHQLRAFCVQFELRRIIAQLQLRELSAQFELRGFATEFELCEFAARPVGKCELCEPQHPICSRGYSAGEGCATDVLGVFGVEGRFGPGHAIEQRRLSVVPFVPGPAAC